MKGIFKNIAQTFVKGLVAGAKDETGEALTSSLSPMLAEEALLQSKMVLIAQMDSLLFSIKELIIKMKRNSEYTENTADDRDYLRMLGQLKDFSGSVESAIKEIEGY